MRGRSRFTAFSNEFLRDKPKFAAIAMSCLIT
jgi:hypothetical protein